MKGLNVNLLQSNNVQKMNLVWQNDMDFNIRRI